MEQKAQISKKKIEYSVEFIKSRTGKFSYNGNHILMNDGTAPFYLFDKLLRKDFLNEIALNILNGTYEDIDEDTNKPNWRLAIVGASNFHNETVYILTKYNVKTQLIADSILNYKFYGTYFNLDLCDKYMLQQHWWSLYVDDQEKQYFQMKDFNFLSLSQVITKYSKI